MTLRADLHVHTCHSTRSGTLRFLGSRDCYSKPSDVYRTAKRRGMDLVAMTDHDSIDGALELLNSGFPEHDVIVGEEISCRLPDGTVDVHLAAYGMTEALHRELQPLRDNVFDVIGCLRQAGVFFALNHFLFFYRGQTTFDRYLRLLDEVPAVETVNGTMLRKHNDLAAYLAGPWMQERSGRPLTMIGGSDSHTLRRVGLTWTEAPGRTRNEFLASLRDGKAVPGGFHGSARAVAGDAYGVIARYVASLAGFGPHDHRSWRRAGCLAFAAASVPFQLVLPAVVAFAGKRREREQIALARTHLQLPEGEAVSPALNAGAEA